jgi:hypothetical protein
MLPKFTRLLAVGTAAAIALVSFAPAPTAEASARSHAVTRAATWLQAHPATADDGISGRIAAATGLAVANRNPATLRARVAALEAEAATNADLNKPGNAANLIILVKAMHLNPKAFGGANLVQKLVAGIDPSGQVGQFGSAYGQALAIMALKRAHEPVPPTVVTTLLSFQDSASGAFGYEFNGFVPDPDSTALAIQALHIIGEHSAAVKTAIDWAKRTQTKKGYWISDPAFGSPVDSTSLMASALKLVHPSSGKAYTWLRHQQLKDGGFAAELRKSTSTSNLLATADATYLLTGKSMATFSYSLKGYYWSPRPKISGTAKAGSTLTAKFGTWNPKPTLAIQWLRSGKPIVGATSATYALTSADLGKRIRVEVVASGIGLKKVTRVSSPTRLVGQ